MLYWKSGNRAIGVDYDECAENPREWVSVSDESEWHIVCRKHLYYSLPDEQHESMALDELLQSEEYQVVPLSFYDHGETYLFIGEQNGWDVRTCGYAWRKSDNSDTEWLQGQLDVWNTWANGRVMFAMLYDLDGNILDSIGGLYCDDAEDAMKEVAENYFGGFNPENAEQTQAVYSMHF